MRLVIQDLNDVDFQGMFETCGDSDPMGLILDGEIIGLVMPWGRESKLTEFGIELEEGVFGE